ncbi:hypothetical protein CXG81DRAFT_24641 [Caulochytrium protostelioides]|uniref:Mitochondrial import inner membrane translocase subunit n=1 Tax=Caulochytrium protostelioides TaxID=1555241 RepID=A0A4V1ITC5_9FUNG|nr:hypothetical protein CAUPRSCDRAFT_7968 [Caulochytrium protostelioides]RKP02674.1 hypothetical protein CXG81DRAFT_24641 [Caulochytrium protostelioides]|eukprot:RKP02674.1 hypothetical protein CXG81DRAFT_24641 [Caulochytrium protostelioides]
MPEIDIADFSDADKADLIQFVEAEKRRATFQTAVNNYTDVCWEKCITRVNSSLSKDDKTCLSNCVERFLDSTIAVLGKLQGTAPSH